MERIAKKTDKIVDTVAGIEDIAFQTNIPALNAAVEAARTGEEGLFSCRKRCRYSAWRPKRDAQPQRKWSMLWAAATVRHSHSSISPRPVQTLPYASRYPVFELPTRQDRAGSFKKTVRK